MRKFFNIFKKELRELITFRMILPFAIAILLMVFVGRIANVEMKKADIIMTIAIADLDQTVTSARTTEIFKIKGFEVLTLQSRERDSLIKEAVSSRARVLIIIPPGFEQAITKKQGTTIEFYSIIKSLGLTEAIKKATIKNLLSVMNQQISDEYIKEFNPDLDPRAIKDPVTPVEYIVFKNKTGPGSANMLLGSLMRQTFMVPVVLLLLIIITGIMIANSVGQEKENKTLETLLTVPVPRFSIVTGKMLAASVLAMIFAGFYMLAMSNYMTSMTSASTGGQDITQMAKEAARNLGFVLDFKANLLFGLNIFFAIIAALSMATLLALFAKDTKDAQATIAPLMILVLIPYFFSTFFDPQTLSLPLRIFIYAIPFSHTFFAIKLLLLGEYTPVILGILYLALLSIALLFIASKIFSSDKILTMKFTFLTGRSK